MEATARAWKDGLAAGEWERINKLVAPDFRFVRPTGNPLSMAGFEEMMGSPDMAFEMSDILAVNKSHEGADSGFICITSHDRFTFKGTRNDDVCVITFAMAKDAAAEFGWKILWGQRSTGRSPEDDAPSGF